MQRVWVVVLSVWAMLAIVAVLAWSSHTAPSPPATSAQTVVVKGPNGKQKLVVVKAPAHATTATSAVAGR
jgi:cyanate permease